MCFDRVFSSRFLFAAAVPFVFRLTSFCPRTSSRPSPVGSVLFCATVPLCSDWLPFVPRTNSRPSPATLFCFAPRFPSFPIDFLLFRALVPGLLQRPCFVSCHGFLCFRTRVLLLPETHSFVFVLAYLLFHAALRWISPLKFFYLNRSMAFVFEVGQTIGCERSSLSTFCLANVFHYIFRPSSGFAYAMPFFFAIQDGVLLNVHGQISSCWDATRCCFRNTVLENDLLSA